MNFPPLQTPAALIDIDIVERNIIAAQAQFNRLGVSFRPHVKTHKLVRFAEMQLAAGAVGITCQKVSEAEHFILAGCDDVFITYNILGEEKLGRLRSLAKDARVSVVADSVLVVAGLSRAFADATVPLEVLVECDTGLGRCGVQTPEAAASLALTISRSEGLVFGGLMTYPPPDSHLLVEDFMRAAKAACISTVGSCPRISSGGTPSMKTLPQGTVVTEYRPGTYIYNDRSLVQRGACTLDDCAMTVIATVVSRPTPDRAILDAGSKVLSSDLLGLSGHGLLRDYPQAIVNGLSEEHGHIDLSHCTQRPEIGEVVAVLPNHACVVTNLLDFVHLHRNGSFVETVRVDARGAVL